jgi:dihydropteroate synthase
MAQIFGILNITPDSFSDGGKYLTLENAIKKAEAMVENGVFAIDIGAESTRPKAQTLDAEEEISRLKHILPEILKLKTKISLDTYHFETAKWGLEMGVSIINDVSGGRDEKIPLLVKEFGATYCFMHSLTLPANPEIFMEGEILGDLKKWAEMKMDLFEKIGISREKLIFDPGIGFGKKAEDSIMIMQNMGFFRSLGIKLLVGHSRKSFLKTAFKEIFAQKEPSLTEKDLMTAVFSAIMKESVDFLRVHETSIDVN